MFQFLTDDLNRNVGYHDRQGKGVYQTGYLSESLKSHYLMDR